MANCSSLNLPDIPTELRRQTTVLAAVEEQRFAVVAFHAFYFTDEDGVIACRVFTYNVARQLGQRAFQQWDSAGGPPITNAQTGMFFWGLFDFREILGERLLASAKNADAEAAMRFQEGEKPGVVIHANENEKRIQRNRSEGIGGHAMHPSRRALNRNYSDARSKCAGYPAKG